MEVRTVNRKEFLRKLQLELYKLPRHEIDDAIAYYNEYFEEAGVDQEQAVIKELGTPSKIATQIKADYAVRQLESMESNRGNRAGANTGNYNNTNGYTASNDSGAGSNRNDKAPGKLSAAWWVVIGIVGGIFAAPIAIPVAFTLAAVLVSLFIGIVALLIAGLVTAIVLIVLSIVAVILGLTLLATSAPLAVLVIGMGLMGISLMALFTVGIVALSNLFFQFIARKHREGQVKRAQRKLEKLQQGTQTSQAAPADQVAATATPTQTSDAAPATPETAAPAEQVAALETEATAATIAEPETKKGGDNDEQ
jgi:uncharacterized membrane protein